MGQIKQKIKKIFFENCPTYIANELLNYKYQYFSNISFSQVGEDMVLSRFFEKKLTGFYVDIGAHHPIRFSNTYKFYLQGWRGINVDAMPGSMIPFQQIRPLDINLEFAISGSSQNLTYYIFNEPALNTFSKEEADKKNGLRQYRIIDTRVIKTKTLKEVLDSYLPVGMTIDFMSIDVEGLDFAVLKSNDWNKYKPSIVIVESLEGNLDEIDKNEIYLFLKEKGYEVVVKIYDSMFFKLKND
ncbi:FkbM family methyltransferase [Dysgonomonas alginatilytica]|uniref:FkbM family methyltransferase n=1 Tax=Dysgonomonas alginatilytica TaxID=1605892 RepID=A0A2V3PQT9_9BACT|nr:FkbM family methyltransferase [Dysgonomonas alginatilytica]PXV64121.1 FkbM family methyltransferase [Dysgonomonas alginatilytica]